MCSEWENRERIKRGEAPLPLPPKKRRPSRRRRREPEKRRSRSRSPAKEGGKAKEGEEAPAEAGTAADQSPAEASKDGAGKVPLPLDMSNRSIKLGFSLSKKGKSSKPARPISTVFGGDKEEKQAPAPLTPLDYDAAKKEMQNKMKAQVGSLLHGPLTRHNASLWSSALNDQHPQATAVVATMQAQAAEAAAAANDMEALRNSIPSQPEAVYAFPVKWEALDKASPRCTETYTCATLSHLWSPCLVLQGNIYSKELRPWVTKQLSQYLGEEADASFVDFIISKLQQHVNPTALHSEIEFVLDKDTDAFLVKLWKEVIFQSMKAAAGQ